MRVENLLVIGLMKNFKNLLINAKPELNFDFRKNNILAYKSAWKKNLLDELFKNHTNKGYTIATIGYWSLKRLQDEANKYKTRNDFKIHNSRAYDAARKVMNDLFKNHPNKGYKYER